MNLIIEALHVDCIDTQVWAANTLAAYGPTAQAAISSLTKLRRSRNPKVRRAAASALQKICPIPTGDEPCVAERTARGFAFAAAWN